MRPAARRCRGDAGSGLIGTITGFLTFLAFLLFAVQLLTNLYATSVVTSATHDGASQAARAEGHHLEPAVRAQAEAHVRRILGDYGADARFDWSGSTADVVRLRVRIENPSFLLRSLPADLPLQQIDRTAVVRVEVPR